MKVKATKMGFDGMKRIRPGTVFELKDEKSFSSNWMQKVEDDEVASRPSKPKKGKSEVSGDSEVI